MIMEQFNTAFIALDEVGLHEFIYASFCELEHCAKDIIKNKGAYQIQVTIESIDIPMDKAQAIQLEDAA